MSPTWARMRSTCSSITLPVVHVGRHPATAYRKCSSTRWPCSLCSTSGWNCTPASRRPASSKAATGASPELATTSKPGGAEVTESPWDIHTESWSGSPANSDPLPVTVSAVRPYSLRPVRVTSPPRAAAMAWKP